MAGVPGGGAWTRASAVVMAALVLAAGWAGTGEAWAASTPDAGTAFEPAAASRPLYDVSEPSSNPAGQRHTVTAPDGTVLALETYLPARQEGRIPPAQLPSILVAGPYFDATGDPESATRRFAREMARRGYAVSLSAVRGTGDSGGCNDYYGPREVDDTARVIDFLGAHAPWASGRVGMYGFSYEAQVALNVAASGDRGLLRHLKALVPISGSASAYQQHAIDGVRLSYGPDEHIYYGLLLGLPRGPGGQPLERPGCQPETQLAEADFSGDFTPYNAAREHRRRAERIAVPTLLAHGVADVNVRMGQLTGLYDRIPSRTVRKAVIGQWPHVHPDDVARAPAWARADWQTMVLAWFDRWLKELPTGVEQWPAVQVQDSQGQWRIEPDWPTPGGPVGQLGLSANGRLGDGDPTGSSAFAASSHLDRGGWIAFETEPLEAPLRLTGRPMLDLWVMLDRPAGHIAARLEPVDPEGKPVGGGPLDGLRSLRHLDPWVEGRFEQAQGRPAPVAEPVRVAVRLNPTDLVVPAGGRLRLRLAAEAQFVIGGGPAETVPSGDLGSVRILHDCDHPSALRFVMPREKSRLLNVREPDEAPDFPLTSGRARDLSVDGGGLGRRPLCGRAPQRNETLGPARGYANSPARRMRLRVRPRVLPRGRRVTVRFRVSSHGRPVTGARIRFAGRQARTGSRGRGRLGVRFERPGRRLAVARHPQFRRARAVVRVR